jgi:hypothetical protein
MMISWDTTHPVDEMFNHVLQSEHTSPVQTIYSIIMQDHVVNAWDHLDGQCIMRRGPEKG